MIGRIHSYQTLGTLDGPGVRFLVFLKGCHLHCGYCHNPDTWSGEEILAQPEEVLAKILRYRTYFGENGGVTVSGGEPLLQAEFVRELFFLCKANGLHTALDTSGSLWDDSIADLLCVTDLVLLDLKMTTEEAYQRHIGCSLAMPLHFLKELEARRIPCWIRQVIVPGVNDTEENIDRLNTLLNGKSCIQRVELLPFRKLCKEKYDRLQLKFPFDCYPEATAEEISHLTKLLSPDLRTDEENFVKK